MGNHEDKIQYRYTTKVTDTDETLHGMTSTKTYGTYKQPGCQFMESHSIYVDTVVPDSSQVLCVIYFAKSSHISE